MLSIITNIGHDHMDLLGETLGKIAFEKAGIIKRNVPVVIGETIAETKKIFSEIAARMKSDLYASDGIFECSLEDSDPGSDRRKFTLLKKDTGELITGWSALLGDYQKNNLPVVYSAVEILRRDLHISHQNFIDGIRKVTVNTGLNGRWQILGREPLIVCDTGHNMEGLQFVVQQISRIPKSGLHMVIGFVRDKDLGAILPLFPKDAKYYFTKASVPRALDERMLQAEAERFGLKGHIYGTVPDGFKAAKENASADEMIFIGGSTFVVAEVL
jgi:dihydrofolate synthase/folylpolyglutamate synthase